MTLVTSGPVPLVRVVLASGHHVECAHGHLFFRPDMVPVAAEDLAPGDLLQTAYRYPEGYVPPDLPPDTPGGHVAVLRVEPAGHGTVMRGTVRDTHVLYLTAGVLCGE
jgi:intein/homing endonuclease